MFCFTDSPTSDHHGYHSISQVVHDLQPVGPCQVRMSSWYIKIVQHNHSEVLKNPAVQFLPSERCSMITIDSIEINDTGNCAYNQWVVVLNIFVGIHRYL